MSKPVNFKVKLSSTVGEVTDGEVVIDLKSDDDGFAKAEELYKGACDYRADLVGAITSTVAKEAVTQFANEDVDVVTGSMMFGSTTLGATVHRSFTLGDDSLDNHVVVTSSDDYTAIVSGAIAGIFDGEAE